MSSISKALRFLTSYEFFLPLCAATALTGGLLMYFLGLGLWDVAGLMPSKVFLSLIFINRLSGLVIGIWKREKTLVLAAGILTILCGFSLNYAYRFEGIAGPAEGEGLSDFNRIKKGPLAKPPIVPLTLRRVEGNPFRLNKEAKAELYYNNNSAETALLSQGQSKVWPKGMSISVLTLEPAPRFIITDKSGKELYSSFVKLRLSPEGQQDYFTVPILPHRFYVSLTGNDDKPLNLKVMRAGKLIVSNKDIALAEEVEFDRFKISFPESSAWAEIQVRHYPGNKVLFIGIAIIAIGGLMLMLKAGDK